MQLANWTFAESTLIPESKAARIAWGAVSLASGAASAYHGVKRHDGSVGWGLLWGLAGSVFPIITPVVALAQGYGKRKR